MNLQFLGGVDTVTGSKTLVTAGESRLLVDCGQFQGLKALRLQNWERPPFELGSLDGVLLTHAHLDHSGWLPVLTRHGYRGPVWCTPGTANLLAVLLADAAHIQEEDARYANRKRYSKHDPALPLFDREDADRALSLVRTAGYGERVEVAKGVMARFMRAGHIVGAARIELEHAHETLVFSGDVGRADDLLLKAPAKLGAADWLVVESTYGDRLHEQGDPLDAMERAIKPVIRRGGVVMVPCFAVGRAQAVLHLLAQLMGAGRLPRVPVYLDSPMAIEATRIYRSNVADHRITEAQCEALCDLATFTASTEDSKALNGLDGPFIVLAGSGMATGGRILHHLEHRGADPRNALLLSGYQAEGTRGRQIVEGARSVKLHGRFINLGAEVIELGGLSGHADQQGLLDWLATAPRPPRRLFLNHGEPAAARALAEAVTERLGWPVTVAHQGQSVSLGAEES